jgi:hypothetical protein
MGNFLHDRFDDHNRILVEAMLAACPGRTQGRTFR